MKEAENWKRTRNKSLGQGERDQAAGYSRGGGGKAGKGENDIFYNIFKRVKHICIK